MKNLTVYRSPAGWIPELNKLDDNLSSTEKLGYSWKVIRNGAPFIMVGDNIFLVCEKQEKLLPVSVINRELVSRCDNIEQLQGYKVGKKQKRDLKEQIISGLLNKAFTTSKLVNVWINTKENILCIETTSDSVARDVYLRLANDIGYRGHRMVTEKSVDRFMSNMILADDSCIDNFSLGRSCVIQGAESNTKKITYKNESLDTGVVSNYVMQGKRPVKLEIVLGPDECFFTIDSKFVISKITLKDIVENRSEFDTDDDYFDNELTIRSGQCLKIINALIGTLGEVSEQQSEAA